MEVFAHRAVLVIKVVQLLLLGILPIHFSLAHPSCNATERNLLSSAFAYVSGFDISLLVPNTADNGTNCSPSAPPLPPITEVRLPSRNLRGTVSWILLHNISTLRVLDLSSNALRGAIPAGFWSAPGLVEVNIASNRLGGAVGFDPEAGRPPSSSLRALNLSGNRFTNTVRLSGFPHLRVLDLSRNDLKTLPAGLRGLAELEHLDISGCNISGDAKPLANLRSLRYLDASRNRMSGSFPVDFPPLAGLTFLNISINNFTGSVSPEQSHKFGNSAFSGTLLHFEKKPAQSSSSSLPKKHGGEEKSRKKLSRPTVVVLAVFAALSSVLAIAVTAACICWKRRRTTNKSREKKWAGMTARRKGERPSGKVMLDMEARATAAPWVAELTAAGPAVAASPVVMFEKPLMQVTFLELAAATSGFGFESQLAEGRRIGPVYRAVLPGEMDVVVKVLEKASEVEATEATAMFQDLGRLKHPNILPLLGYCIAGRKKLLLYEYMENGDLHRWLHELPAGHPNVEDWSADTWDQHGDPSRGVASRAAAAFPASERTAMGWATRHRIALGIARGLAFLHHAGSRPIVHGHLVPSNILLDDDFEPRIADFGTRAGDGRTEEDVYCYGLVLVELLTGRPGSPEMTAWVRGLARGREAARCLDPRLRQGGAVLSESEEEAAEREMVEALRVAFLCTAESAEKRPTMRQVVGLLKDIRPCSPSLT